MSIACGVPSTSSCVRAARSNAWLRYVRISESTRSARRIANARRATADSARSSWKPKLAAAEEVHRARRVEQRGDLGEPIAAPLRRDRRELGAGVRDQRPGAHRSVSSSASSRRFRAVPAGAVPAELERLVLAGGDDPMAGDDERPAVPRAEAPRGPSRAWPTREAGEPAVGDDLAPSDRARGGEELPLERRQTRSSTGTSSYETAVPARWSANRRHRSGTKSSLSRDGSAASVTSGGFAPPWGPPAPGESRRCRDGRAWATSTPSRVTISPTPHVPVVEDDVVVRHRDPLEVRRETPAQTRHEVVTLL